MMMQVLQGVLGLMFAMAGSMKLIKDKEELAVKMGWANDFSSVQVKMIGGVELLSAIGLVAGLFVPGMTLFAKIGAGLIVFIMLGASYTHLRRKETGMVIFTLVLLGLAVWLGIGL